MSATPVASVIIRTLNEAPSIGGVLGAVLAQQGAGPVEVVVIDSSSSDATREIARRFPVRLEVIERGAFTFGGALNLGARLAKAPLCVHLSGHSRPTDDRWLDALLTPFADARVVATYGRQRALPGVNTYEEIELERAFPAGSAAAGGRQFFSNANCAIRRARLLERPFDDAITSMEDALWLHGLARHERVVYVPEAAVFHSHPLRFAYWYARYWRDGVAYRYLSTRGGLDLLPERSLRPRRRVVTVAHEWLGVTSALAARGAWRHLAAYPLFCALREVALHRGLRHGRRLYHTQPTP